MRKKYWCEEFFFFFFIKLDALCSTLRHQTQQLQDVIFVEPIETGHIESNRKAMNRNWSNQKSKPALKTKAGNK